MTEAKVTRMRIPQYAKSIYPPLPPRVRLAANCWERVWWLSLSSDVSGPQLLEPIGKRFSDEHVQVRAQMRTLRRLCFAITGTGLTEQDEFELAMTVMAFIDREIAPIERVHDRAAEAWPYDHF